MNAFQVCVKRNKSVDTTSDIYMDISSISYSFMLSSGLASIQRSVEVSLHRGTEKCERQMAVWEWGKRYRRCCCCKGNCNRSTNDSEQLTRISERNKTVKFNDAWIISRISFQWIDGLGFYRHYSLIDSERWPFHVDVEQTTHEMYTLQKQTTLQIQTSQKQTTRCGFYKVYDKNLFLTTI